MFLWLILAWKLNRNHQLIVEYKEKLMEQSTIEHDGDVIAHLEFIIERKSPFAICGRASSNHTLGILVTSNIIPLVFHVYRAADSYAAR